MTVDENIVTITQGGTYSLSGTLDDGQVIVNAGDLDQVEILLNGVHLTSSTSAPIYVMNADKTTLTLVEGTESVITDAESYVYEDATVDEPNAAIFSKDDLKINGTGSLIVNANYNNGIASKDDLDIKNGDITINAVNNGLKGKDSIEIDNSEIENDEKYDILQQLIDELAEYKVDTSNFANKDDVQSMIDKATG